jgi:L-threonylcarbamoyladenylate synthase
LSPVANTAARSVPATLAEAVAAIRAGKLVVYPTETFYGLGADPSSESALERLFEVKQREAGKPVALIAADAASAFSIAREVSDAARRLAGVFWPGPLTLVMPARAGFASALLGDDGGIGVRVSPHPIACALAAGLGHPITATSANLSGEPPATTLAETRVALDGKVEAFLDGGTLAGGAPSTVVTFDGAGIRIVRAGAISEQSIAAVLGGGHR